MQTTSWSCWFRIVSTRIAVLPVERSPMISSRWPRPTFVIESIALMPVMSGSFTGWRAITPGALNSSGRRSSASIGPRPSSALPSGSTTRPSSASPTGTLATRPVRRTGWPSLISCHSPKSAVPTSSSSRLKARPTTPWSNSSISIATAFSSPYTRAMPSPICRTVPTSARSVSTSYCSILCRRIDVISSGRSFKVLSAPHECLSQSYKSSAHAGVDEVRAGPEHDAAEEVGVDTPSRLYLATGCLLDLPDDRSRFVVRQLACGRELDAEAALLARHQPLELLRDLLELAGTTLLRRQEQEVLEQRLVVAGEIGEDTRLRRGLELRVAQHRVQLGRLLDRRREIGERLVHLPEPAGLLGRLEEGLGVDAVRDGDL